MTVHDHLCTEISDVAKQYRVLVEAFAKGSKQGTTLMDAFDQSSVRDGLGKFFDYIERLQSLMVSIQAAGANSDKLEEVASAAEKSVDSIGVSASPQALGRHFTHAFADRLETVAEMFPATQLEPLSKVEQAISKLRQLLREIEDEPFEDDSLQAFVLQRLRNLILNLEQMNWKGVRSEIHQLAFAETTNPKVGTRILKILGLGLYALNTVASGMQIEGYISSRYEDQVIEVQKEIEAPVAEIGSGEAPVAEIGSGEETN